MVTAAAIYARISSDPDGDQLGVRRQVEDCEAYAAKRGWPVAEVYIDDDVSAYSGKVRPQYRRMLGDISDGTVDAVIAWNLDRLHRQPKELEVFFETCDAAHVRDIATLAGDVDLGSHDGRFHARILGAVARKESDDKSRRLIRKHQELAQAGRSVGGGDRPFGYQADRLTVEPTEAAAIREAASRIRAGDSLRSVAADWNKRGIVTVRGGPWSVTGLGRMMKNPRLSGQRSYRGEIVARGTWDAILTDEDTAHLMAVLNDPARRISRTVRRYLLAGGLLRCSLCDAVLVARPTGGGVRRYICAKGPGFFGCGHITINAEPTEVLLVRGVLHRLDTPELAAGMVRAAAEDAEAEVVQGSVDADRAQLAELAQAYGEKQITFAEYLVARKPIETRIEVGQRKVSRLTQTSAIANWVGKADELRAQWSDLPLTRQRGIVASVLDRAIVRPSVRGGTRLFDPERVEAVWRL